LSNGGYIRRLSKIRWAADARRVLVPRRRRRSKIIGGSQAWVRLSHDHITAEQAADENKKESVTVALQEMARKRVHA
jgi:hypothetical protein